jgi:D-serine deaminase-like pyridoxal phosphate-dependent protein
MQEFANNHGLELHPMIKTHKSLEIASIQMDEGAVGLTASKPLEALVFLEANIAKKITVTFPVVDPESLFPLINAANYHGTDLRLVCDSKQGVEAASEAARRAEYEVKMFIKIDVGLHRCGLRRGDPRIIKLAEAIEKNKRLVFQGILSHAGQSYGARNKNKVLRDAKEEKKNMNRVKCDLEGQGFRVLDLSIGATPTLLAVKNLPVEKQKEYLVGVTEIRPGNYVFMDRTPLRLRLIESDPLKHDIAFTVVATVSSKNKWNVVIDAGSKFLTSEAGAHGIRGMKGYGLVYPMNHILEEDCEGLVKSLSEEHGKIDLKFKASLKDRVVIIPNHSCTVCAANKEIYLFDDDKFIKPIDVSARALF